MPEIVAAGNFWEIGRSERIRTSDPLVPNEVRYQAALHSDGAASGAAGFIVAPRRRRKRDEGRRQRPPGARISRLPVRARDV